MRAILPCLLASALLASATPALEIVVNLGQPDVALRSDSDGLIYTRYDREGVTIELETQGGGSFGYWNDDLLPEDEDYPDDVTPYVEDVTDCGNDDACTPYVATFSTALDAARVSFGGVGNFSGSSTEIVSASYFLEAWSGPNGIGTLLASLGTTPFLVPVPNEPNSFRMPASLTASAPGIRSIVFGAAAITDEYTSPVNLLSGAGLRLTVIPEPASGALAALGLAGLALRSRRRP